MVAQGEKLASKQGPSIGEVKAKTSQVWSDRNHCPGAKEEACRQEAEG